MIDLHCHILPGVDDGAPDLETAINGKSVRCRRRINCGLHPAYPAGLYHNSGPQIRHAVAQLQQAVTERGIPLEFVTGADNHVVPDFLAELRAGKLLSLADTRYVLVEPPHHVAPPRLEELFFSLISAQYVPILTHPERLTWISSTYEALIRLNHQGSGSKSPQGLWLVILGGMRDTGANGYWTREKSIFLRRMRTT